MRWNSPVTELTTAGTDVLLAGVAFWAVWALRRVDAPSRWKAGLWSWVFRLLFVGAALGAVIHGIAWTSPVRDFLWMPLYLSLGVTVALFAAGAVADVGGVVAGKRVLPWCLAAAVMFFGVTQVGEGTFLWFVMYESAAMVLALGIYGYLAAVRRRPGAAFMTLGILLTMAASAVQAGKRAHVTIIWPINHDGIFHLIQMAGVVVLVLGLRRVLTAGEPQGRG